MAWMVWSMQAHGVAPALLTTDGRVRVARGDVSFDFTPVDASPATPALIFLPGGLVDPTAYVPLVRQIADAGFVTAIVTLPYRMAFTDAMQAELFRRVLKHRADLGDGRAVALAGHSRGAAMAAAFAARHADALSGLVLIGTTHPRDHDLSQLRFPVTKVGGTRDCVADLDDARANSTRLPAHTIWVDIDGANHSQFGFYGSQLGDCRAAITRDEQQRHTRAALLDVLTRLARPPAASSR